MSFILGTLFNVTGSSVRKHDINAGRASFLLPEGRTEPSILFPPLMMNRDILSYAPGVWLCFILPAEFIAGGQLSLGEIES
jgi:hypothetical protein